ncbi:methionyl-tRNA formyltransferase [Candidatus Poribacteria bacterium]|nr:MAG: methionyl-tRNA formyltransferase [Candidatus Poribacteria bacterium]
MRILFMGTSEFAVPALRELVTHKFDLIGVVTQPDRPSGRGKRLSPPPVKIVATEHSLPVYQPEKVRKPDFIRGLEHLAPDIIIVAAFGQLLPQTVLDIPPCGTINLHPSLLPKYRGAAPIQWALINGETETGVTLMLLDAGEDTGDIISTCRIPIQNEDNAFTLTEQLAQLGANQLVRLLSEMPEGAPPPATPQNNAEATRAPRLTKEIGHINWSQPATTIHNLVRGTAIWPGAYTFFRNNLRLKIINCQPLSETFGAPSGTLKIVEKRKLLVTTADGMLQLLQIQPATKKVMEASDFINGYQLQTGEQLFAATSL